VCAFGSLPGRILLDFTAIRRLLDLGEHGVRGISDLAPRALSRFGGDRRGLRQRAWNEHFVITADVRNVDPRTSVILGSSSTTEASSRGTRSRR
jgi:hypothetical protein